MQHVDNDTLLMGYGKKSIIPSNAVQMAGYGRRPNYTEVHDSIYIRTCILKGGTAFIAIVSLDLMIVTPEIADGIEEEFKKFGINYVYFSASHSHSSIGGYGNSIAGQFILGRDEGVLNAIFAGARASVTSAFQHLKVVEKAAFGSTVVDYTRNRLLGTYNVDQRFRRLEMGLENGERASLFSFNVHPTIIDYTCTQLSNDYPGALCAMDTSDFSMFLGGTMGSTKHMAGKAATTFDIVNNYAKKLLSEPMQMDIVQLNTIGFSKIDIPLQPLAMSLTSMLQVRPWVCNLVFDDAPAYIRVLRLGDVLFIGLPVELSSEYYPEMERLANKKGLKLMLTGFNGTYLGYAVPSEYFEIRHGETRETNWIGKYGGDYFAQVIRMILEKQ